MGCQSGPWFKKPQGLFAAGSFWKLAALWHPQPSIGLCCWIASYYPKLRRIVFGNRMLTFSFDTNLQVGPSSSPCARGWWWASFVGSCSCFGYLLSLLINELQDSKIAVRSFYQGLTGAVHAKPHILYESYTETPSWAISPAFFSMLNGSGNKLSRILLRHLGCDGSWKNNEAVHLLSVSPHVMFSRHHGMSIPTVLEWCWKTPESVQ